MQISRHYTRPDADPFAGISFSRISIEKCHADAHTRLCLPDFEVPEGWSYAACEFLALHFLRRSGVPAQRLPVPEEGVPMWLWRSVPNHDVMRHLPAEERFGGETSVRQVILRLAGAWTYWGFKHDYFDTEADARAFRDECCYLMATQRIAPAAPQWLNTGLHWAYGIEGEAQGHFHVEARSGKVFRSTNAYEHPPHHHCFIQSVRDELASDGGIMSLWEREVRLFKYGSGSGCNMSAIRSQQESIASGSLSVGLMRFMEIGDNAVGAIKAAGGAAQVDRLILLDADHPETLSFIDLKARQQLEHEAARCGSLHLIRAIGQLYDAMEQVDSTIRYDLKHNSLLRHALHEARKAQLSETVLHHIIQAHRQGLSQQQLTLQLVPEQHSTAQRATLGLRLTDAAMQSSTQPWPFIARTDNSPTHHISQHELMRSVARGVWSSGSPCIQFADTIEQWHGCKTHGPIRGSGPRGEFLFVDDTACDTATLNLMAFVRPDAEFDTVAFEHVSRLMVLMLDIAITMGQYPSRSIAINTYRLRPIGLSYCNMAAALMQMGYAYDSDEARAMAAAITALMTGAGYVASADLARELGAFEAFSENRESMLRLMWQHHEAALGRATQLKRGPVHPCALDHASLPQQAMADAIHRVWDLALIRGDDFGYSNAQISVISAAPNATRLLDAACTGLLPMHNLVKIDALADGQKIKYVRPQLFSALRLLGYSPVQIDDIVRHLCGTASLKDAPTINHESLQKKGFTLRQIAHIEEALGYVRQLRHAFDPFVIGEGFCRDVLRLNDLQMHDASFDMLSYLGFSQEQIEAAHAHACGHATLLQAPHLREEDMAVFSLSGHDIAEGASVSAVAQIEMMAAVQPFVSGGIAHPLMLPEETGLDEIAALTTLAWHKGLKVLHMQRKYTEATPVIETAAPMARQKRFSMLAPRTQTMQPKLFGTKQPAALPEPAAQQSAPQRIMLPARREGFIQKATVGDQTIYLHVGHYPDGKPGEIFIDLPGQPEPLRAMANHFAIAVSLGLQHGLPLEALRPAFTASAFAPSGTVEGSDHVHSARSLLDFIYQEMAGHYSSRQNAVSPSIPETMMPETITETIPLTLPNHNTANDDIGAQIFSLARGAL